MARERAPRGSGRVTLGFAAADLAVAIGALGLGLAAFRLFAFPHDDAFIHFRIARNLAERGQPYFNLGEPVMGGSSPLWMLLLAAAFSALGTASYAFIGVAEAAIVAAVAVLVHRLVAGPRPGTAATALAALLTTSTLVPSAGGGMETPLAMLLLAGTALAMARDRFALAGALLALGVACRYELLVTVPAAFAAAPRGRRGGLAVAFAAGAGAGTLWLLASYGTAVPNTVYAKSVVYQLTRQEFLSQFPPLFGLPPAALFGPLLLSLVLTGAALAVGPLVWRAARSAIPEHRALAVLGALPAALAIAYAVKRPLLFPWYWPLLLFPAMLAISIAGVRWPRVWAGQPSARARWLALGAAAVVAAAPVGAVAVGALETARDLRAVVTGRLGDSGMVVANARARTYLELGADLDRCRPESVLAAEIGALGWAHRGRIIDGVGLVSPEVLRYHPLRVPEERASGTFGAIPARAVADLQPDLVVAMEIFGEDLVRKAPLDPALRRYAIVDSRPVFSETLSGMGLPGNLWASSRVLVLGDPARCPPPALRPGR